MEYLVTPSLYNSWYWYMRSDKPKEEFLNTLNKVKIEPTEAMQAGIEFEANVKNYADDFGAENTPAINEFGSILEGAIWQKKLSCGIFIGDIPVIIYGIADAVKGNTIYDIKYTKNYKIGKYSYSIQHLCYLYCSDEGIDHFEYLVSDAESTWKESYTWDEYSRRILQGRISEMMQSIMGDKDFKEAYLKNWIPKDHHYLIGDIA